jgi:MFS family permease
VVLGAVLVLYMLHSIRVDNSPLEDLPGPHLHRHSLYLVSPQAVGSQKPKVLTRHSWGAAAMCSGAVTNMAELVACRCLLGIFEAAFGAGAPYFLSLFYQRSELGFRVSMLLGMSPVANCFASALAYGITRINNSIAPWRLLFIIGTYAPSPP